MSGGRWHKKRRPDIRHRPHSRVPLPPQRPAARFDGGPLHGLTVHIEKTTADAGVLIVRGGRYVRVESSGDEWMFEVEHTGSRT